MKTSRNGMILGLMLLAGAASAADVLQPEHGNVPEVVITETKERFEVGDFVNVIDGDNELWTVQITEILEQKVGFVTASGQRIEWPVSRIVDAAGWWDRSTAWLLETDAGNWTLGGIVALVGGGAAKVATDAQLSSDKDTDQVNKSEAAALAESAAAAAIVQGPDTREKFWLSGELTSGQDLVAGQNVTWRPAIVFGAQSNLRGGSIASYLLPPAGPGQLAQVVTGQGSWVLSAEGEIYIEDTSGIYDGHARIGGTFPGGTGPFSLRTKGGLMLNGGQATSVVSQE